MTYIPKNVVNYFATRNAVSLNDAEALFSKLDVFLFAASQSRQVPSLEIDEAWHAFILHSKEYAEYCINRFGRFIHHVPDDADVLQSDSASGNKCSSNCSSR